MENSAIVWAAGISAFGALLLSIFTAWNSRKKDDATAASTLTGAALEIVEALQSDLDYLRKQVHTLHQVERCLSDELAKVKADLAEEKIARKVLAKALEIAELNIQFLLEYMQKNGLDIPDLKYRGDGD